jgi:hypothetical protein
MFVIFDIKIYVPERRGCVCSGLARAYSFYCVLCVHDRNKFDVNAMFIVYFYEIIQIQI